LLHLIGKRLKPEMSHLLLKKGLFMKKNVGKADRLLRVALAIVIGSLYLSGQIAGIAAMLLGIGAIVFAITGFAGFCPLYRVFGISTRNTLEEMGKGAEKA
jgi:hypothetical protein